MKLELRQINEDWDVYKDGVSTQITFANRDEAVRFLHDAKIAILYSTVKWRQVLTSKKRIVRLLTIELCTAEFELTRAKMLNRLANGLTKEEK